MQQPLLNTSLSTSCGLIGTSANRHIGTAILRFVRDEREEARLKSFHTRLSERERLQVVRTFNRHNAQVTQRSRLPVFVVKGAQQVGNTFGERFANAVESVFAAGYQNVIAVGNDCLSLTSKQLQHIASLLEQGTPLVLGPANDGGVYAIGIQNTTYQRDTFIDIPWQTAFVYDALLEYAQNLDATCACLAVAKDVDDEVSFQSVLASLGFTTPLYKLLKSIFEYYIFRPILNPFFTSNPIFFISLLRAPPIN